LIFAVTGTHNQGFERMVRTVDEIAPKFEMETLIQIGCSRYEPENCKWFRFTPYDQMIRYYQIARVIVSHDGAGSIIDSLKLKKQVIIFPRLKKFKEVRFDNPSELAKKLAALGYVNIVLNALELELEIQRSIGQVEEISFPPKRQNLEDFLIKTLEAWYPHYR
jgi:UDP-N-acetylglucosamine transferase subunit ALG13